MPHWINSADHPLWQWLAKRQGRVAGLTVTLALPEDGEEDQPLWEQPLHQLCPITDLDITLRSDHDVFLSEAPFVAQCQWLSAITCLSKLTRLRMTGIDVTAEELWAALAGLVSLRVLEIDAVACGDPSALSALTGLTFLSLGVCGSQGVEAVPYSFSSLQPLSNLQQLEELNLVGCAGGATSLHASSGLSRLTSLVVTGPNELRSLKGLSTAVKDLLIMSASRLVSLSGVSSLVCLESLCIAGCGIACLCPLAGLKSLQSLHVTECKDLKELSGLEGMSMLQHLEVERCGVADLQPLASLGASLTCLVIRDCNDVEDQVVQLPHVQPNADVNIQCSNVREVVLAGGGDTASKEELECVGCTRLEEGG